MKLPFQPRGAHAEPQAGRKEAAVLRPNAYWSVDYFYRSIFAVS